MVVMMIQGNLDLHSLSDKKPVWHLAPEFGRTQVGVTRRSTGSSRECAHCMILLPIMCRSCRDSDWRAELDAKYIIVIALSAG